MNTIKISGSMPYLICEKCGGYYELGDGESLADFEACQCGGKLKYIESTDELHFESPEQLKYTVCQNYGFGNDYNVFKCSECGYKLISTNHSNFFSKIGSIFGSN